MPNSSHPCPIRLPDTTSPSHDLEQSPSSMYILGASALLCLPEEIQSLILRVAAESCPLLTLLNVCRTFNRICTPFLYRDVTIASSETATLLTHTLVARPKLAAYVRSVNCASSAAVLTHLFHALNDEHTSLDTLDFTLDASWPPRDSSMAADFSPQMVMGEQDVKSGREVGAALSALDVKRLVVRRRRAYLKQERMDAVIDGLSHAILDEWKSLESVTIAFRLTPPSGFQPWAPNSRSYKTSYLPLPIALSRAPKLHTFCSTLPVEWDPTLLTISANPALRRILFTIPRARTCLSARPCTTLSVLENSMLGAEDVIWEDHVLPGSEVLSWGEGSGARLWMKQVLQHPRLIELIGGEGAPSAA